VGVIRDATDRKKAERELSDSRDFLARLFDTSLEGLIVSNGQGYITMVNDSAAAMLDYAKEDLIGKHCGDLGLTPEQDQEQARIIIEKFLKHGNIMKVECTWIKREGRLIDVEMNMTSIKDSDGNMIGAVASFRDISLRKKADMALRASEERYHRIFDNSLVALQEVDISWLMSDLNERKSTGAWNARKFIEEHPEYLRQAISRSTIVDTNDATLKLYGAKDKEELAGSLDKLSTEESLPVFREALIAFAEGKSFFQAESTNNTLQGTQKNILLQINFLIKQRDLNRVLVSIIDITQTKSAEKKLLEYQQQLRALTNQLSIKEEDEKRKTGMYLHDRIGQSLSILKMKMEMMGAELAGGYAGEKSGEILELLEKTIHDTRVLSYELSPVILHELGLEVALEWLTEQTQKQHNIAVSFKSDKKAKQLDESLKIIVYRAVSELLNNVVKHARADNAVVSMKGKNGQLQITVEDNGVGFDPSEIDGIAAAERGFGLFSIKERLHYLGGNILIKSARNQGTRITLFAPLK
jgi:PAS domain S-box-containing protein